MSTLMERANKISAEGIFLGGRPARFETAGRTLLINLLDEGLLPCSRVLDIGCGCLRGGYWLIHFLDQGNYCGIEPNQDMVNAGIKHLLEPGVFEQKQPRFDHNNNFNFNVFGDKFNFFVGLSIWTHAPKAQIQQMLDGFVLASTPDAIFFTSYYPATLFKPDYKGAEWIGPGNPLKPRGMVHHSLSWIKKECGQRDLVAHEKNEKSFKYWNQTWLVIKHKQNPGS